jgi:hypothetical protein
VTRWLARDELEVTTWVGDRWTRQPIADELQITLEAAKKRVARLEQRAASLIA